jgi:XTP/dITP diphosphohydrolase
MKEIRRILASVPDLELLSLDEAGLETLPEEDRLEPFETFEQNAASKARYFHARSGLPTVADDSGIEVGALDGAPGVRSKRFAPLPEGTPDDVRDAENNRHLLEQLHGFPSHERSARYVCVVVLEEGTGEPLVVRGEAEGIIAAAPSGSGGFGYDPLFFDPVLEKTFAEILPDEKNARSHRGAAFRKLAEAMRSRALS